MIRSPTSRLVKLSKEMRRHIQTYCHVPINDTMKYLFAPLVAGIAIGSSVASAEQPPYHPMKASPNTSLKKQIPISMALLIGEP